MFFDRRPFDLSFTDGPILYPQLLLPNGSVEHNVQSATSLVSETKLIINRAALSLEYSTQKWQFIGERVLSTSDIDAVFSAPDIDGKAKLRALSY